MGKECKRYTSAARRNFSNSRRSALEALNPRDAQRAVPSAEVASQARSIRSLFPDKGSERAL